MLHKFFNGDIGIVDIGNTTIKHLAKIVGRHVGGHTYSDTVRAIDQQVGYFGGEHSGFLTVIVVSRHHIDSVFVDIGEHFVGNLFHASLGVTHGSSAVAIDRAKVTLPIDKHVAHSPWLSQTHHGAIHRRVAVGVILTKHLTDHSSRFLIRGVIEKTHVVHGIEDTTVDRFQTVANVRQRTGNNNRHSIIDIGRLHFGFYIDLSYFFVL